MHSLTIIPCSAIEVIVPWSWYGVEGKVHYREKKLLLSEGKEISVTSSFVFLHADSRGYTNSQASARSRRGDLSPDCTLLTA